MRDIVEKYQYYFSESIKLQKIVNEQAAYIAELEEAVNELIEVYRITPKRRGLLNQIQTDAEDAAADAIGPEGTPSEKEWDTAGRAFARSARVDLLKMRGQPADKRKFTDHPDLKLYPDAHTPANRRKLSDVALNRALAQERKVEKAKPKRGLTTESNEESAQDELNAVDRIMADIMPGVKAKNRPMMKPKKPVDLTPEALRLKAQEDLEK